MEEPSIVLLHEKKLIGKKIVMSFSDDKTRELWQSFMPRRKEIHSINPDLYSIQTYTEFFFSTLNSHAEFEKWAAIGVSSFDTIPDGMETIIVPEGLYAVFIHHGPASKGVETFQHIFTTWLPNSKYTLDNRPHFEVLGERYKNDDPDSEEEIWIPVKGKSLS